LIDCLFDRRTHTPVHARTHTRMLARAHAHARTSTHARTHDHSHAHTRARALAHTCTHPRGCMKGASKRPAVLFHLESISSRSPLYPACISITLYIFIGINKRAPPLTTRKPRSDPRRGVGLISRALCSGRAVLLWWALYLADPRRGIGLISRALCSGRAVLLWRALYLADSRRGVGLGHHHVLQHMTLKKQYIRTYPPGRMHLSIPKSYLSGECAYPLRHSV
jgi:hypothetical protein